MHIDAVYMIPIAALIVSLTTMVLSWYTMKQKAGDRDLQLLNATVQIRLAALTKELEQLRERNLVCEKHRSELLSENIDLMRRLIRDQR